MRKFILCATWVLLMTGNALGGTGGFGLSIGGGMAQDNIHVARMAIRKDFAQGWLKSKVGYLSGYYELSFNRWNHGKHKINAWATSPVFAFFFNGPDPAIQAIHPYVEAGIGGTYIDRRRIMDRDLTTSLVFENRVGIGIRINELDLNVRYMHYSNGAIKEPNDGIDIFMGSLTWYF